VSAGPRDIIFASLSGRRCAHRRCRPARSRWGRARRAPARPCACAASAARRLSASLIRPTRRPRPSVIRPTRRWTPRPPRSGRRTSRRSCASRSAQSFRYACPAPQPTRALSRAGGRGAAPHAACSCLPQQALCRAGATPGSAACGRPGVCSTGQDGSLQGLSDMASDSSNSSKACVWQPSETGELLACAAGPGCEPLRTTYCPKPLAVTCDPRRRLRRRPARARPRPSGCASSCATACAPSSLRSCALACALRSPRSLRPSCALSWRRRSAHGASATLRSSCAEPASAWTASCLMMGPPVCGEVIRRQC